MRTLIIFAAIAACCVAAPSSLNRNEPKQPADVPLERPSPINPELPMPPKPAEKITLITDPIELAKHKREIVESTHHATFAQIAPTLSLTPINPTTPTNDQTVEPSSTQQPDKVVQREKRDDQVLVDSKKVQPLKPVEKPTSTTAKPTSTTKAATSSTPRRTYSPRTTYVPRKSKPTTEVPTNLRQARGLESSPPQPAEISTELPLIFRNVGSEHKVPLQIPQGAPNPTHIKAKRDIPVPLVPKHPHPEESPKESEESDEKKNTEEKPNEDQKPNEQHKEDEQPSKVTVKREDLQIEALSSSVVPAAKPAEEHAQVTASQQQDVKNTQQQHELVAGQQHGNHQLHNLNHQLQHAEQTESQSHVANDALNVPHNQHKYEHHTTQHTFQPEHTYVARTTQKIDVVTSADSASSSTSSTTEHPLFRTKPVPVAELFARSHH